MEKSLCAQGLGLCRGVVRKPCALGLCAQGCAYLCAQRRMVVRGGCVQNCAQWCAQVVRSPGAKSCALRTAQGFTLVQKSTCRTAQGFEPCAILCSLIFTLNIVLFSLLYYLLLIVIVSHNHHCWFL